MAEEYQAGICGETWWNINNSTRGVFPLMMNSSSTCSIAANDGGNYSTWQNEFFGLKETTTTTKSCSIEETNTNFDVSDGSFCFLDTHKPQQSESANLIDSTLQIMDFGLSSPTSSNWNHSLFGTGRPENNFHSVLEEETMIESSNNSQIQKEWNTKNMISSTSGIRQVSTLDAFKPMDQEFSLDEQSGLSCGFPIETSNSYDYPSTLIQSLFDPQTQPQPQTHNSLFTNPCISYSSSANYGTSSNEVSSPTWSKISSLMKPSMPKQQLSGLQFSNNTPFWNASAEALNDIRAGVLASSQAQYQSPNFEDKRLNCPITLLNKLKREESPERTKKNSSEGAVKRARIETPSPLPTFKVRKEKLGDRITALQQLVSPFGKTDTASVLHEAIEYIKFLHDQVNVLSAPYMKNGSPIQHHQGCDNVKESEGKKQDLRSQGLCLVPIASTFPVTNETIVDFWTPSFGGPLFGR
ncbi:transcription factor bHLH112-like isoform X2 [Cicer arietinum]|uniref:Transcription factor bHLH112-like isoform X2 n=1 Tax=Cicer arietinum TaxID=3827 RepID=A0A1S2X9L0_CICAR|nr:transcription factor bHLH112-like isoform X2 [Cicer arietinum]